MFQRNQFLGEICIPFDTYEFEVLEEKYYQLCDYSQLDMIPNPNLQRTRSTIYRVRTKLPEQPTNVPTLYDSSMDLRGEEEGKGDKESAALGGEGAHKQEDMGFTLPVINVESEDFRSQSHEESNVEAVNVQHTPSPTSSPETTSRPSSSMSQHKDEDQTKLNKKKSPSLVPGPHSTHQMKVTVQLPGGNLPSLVQGPHSTHQTRVKVHPVGRNPPNWVP